MSTTIKNPFQQLKRGMGLKVPPQIKKDIPVLAKEGEEAVAIQHKRTFRLSIALYDNIGLKIDPLRAHLYKKFKRKVSIAELIEMGIVELEKKLNT